jgi:hypothetical protein
MFKKFSWKKLITTLVCAVLVAGLTVSVIEYVYATQHVTLKLTKESVNGMNYLTSSYTFTTATDTVWIPFNLVPNSQVPTQAQHDSTIAEVVIETQRAVNANTAPSICVRWQYSFDGASYNGATVGTDSTTWAAAAADSASNPTGKVYAVAGAVIGPTIQPFFWAPYNRLMIFGKSTGNGANVRFRAHIVPR